MQKFISLLFTTAVFSVSLCFAQQVAKKTFQPTTFDIGYLEYLPPGYNDTDKEYPLLIFLHGGGQSGNGTPESLERVKDWGPPRLIQEGHNMCFEVNGTEECFIVLSPQYVANDAYAWPFIVSLLLEHIALGPDQYRVDTDRIYLTGLSRGGMGVYQFAASHLNEPNSLAAIAPIAAWTDEDDIGCIISQRRLPVWSFHGLEDTVVPYNMGWAAFSMIFNCKNPFPNAELNFTTYDDYGKYHDSWLPAYDTSNLYHSPNLYQWLLLQSKSANELPVTGIERVGSHHDEMFSLHPNPTDRYVSVTFKKLEHKELKITVLNTQGKEIFRTLDPHDDIDLSGVPSGVYFVLVRSADGNSSSRRLVVIR